jgi:hypothetical protein
MGEELSAGSGEGSAKRPTHLAVAGFVFGEKKRIGSTIYGTILVLAGMIAAYAAERHDPARLVGFLVSGVLVIWIAYVYAHAISESIQSERHLDWEELKMIAGRELGVVTAAVGPVFVLLFGAAGLVSENVAVWLAIGVGLATLTVQGYRFARVGQLGHLGTVGVVAANLALGLTVVAMKAALLH